jgi:hypothetical protein
MGQKKSQEACRSGRYVTTNRSLILWRKVRPCYDQAIIAYVDALQTCSHR